MFKGIALGLLFVGLPLAAQNSSIQETGYYSFPNNRNQPGPYGRLAVDSAGAVYGAAYDWQYVYIYQLQQNNSPAFTETTIYNFHASTVLPNATPTGDLVVHGPGQLFGLTLDQGEFGCGTLYSLTTPSSGTGSWTAAILYSFPCLAPVNSIYPGSLLLVGGNLYAITYYGGQYGHGSVIELASASGGGAPWTKETIYSFTGGADGGKPLTLIADQSGSLYGTTSAGGATPSGGVAFKLSTPAQPGGAWTQSVLLNLPLPGAQRSYPMGTLGLDPQGNVYGVVTNYSATQQLLPEVFELSPPAVSGGSWIETTICTLGTDNPNTGVTSGVFVAAGGDIYGSAWKPRFNDRDAYVYRLNRPANPGDPWLENVVFAVRGTTLPALTTLGPGGNALYGSASFYFGSPGWVFMLSQ